MEPLGQVLRKMNTESHMLSPNFSLQLFLSVCICLCINVCAQAQKGIQWKLEDWVFSSDYVSSGTGKVITLTSKRFCSCSDNRWLGTLGVLEWVKKRSVAIKSVAYSVTAHYLYAWLIIYVKLVVGPKWVTLSLYMQISYLKSYLCLQTIFSHFPTYFKSTHVYL